MTIYTARYHDAGPKQITGTLPELSAQYLAHCTSHPEHRHGPATLLAANGVEAGFINSKGEVYLKQPSHVLAYDPKATA